MKFLFFFFSLATQHEYLDISEDGTTVNGLKDMFYSGPVNIPDQIEIIGQDAFRNNKNITALTLPEGLRTILNGAFYGCSSLKGNLVFPDTVTSIGQGAFEGCSGFSGSLVLPSLFGMIEDYSFAGCSGITGTLVLPDTVWFLGMGAFENCSGITDLHLSFRIASIYMNTFKNCSNLREVHFGSALSFIDACAFENCYSLEVCYFDSTSVTFETSSFNNTLSLTMFIEAMKCTDFVVPPHTFDNSPMESQFICLEEKPKTTSTFTLNKRAPKFKSYHISIMSLLLHLSV